MKLNSFLLPALAGIATADPSTPSHAEAYMLTHTKQSTTSEPPSIPDSLAESILLQRLSSPEHPSTLGHIPASLEEDEAISYVNAFGKPPRPLFASADTTDEPKQLIIAFSGVTPSNHKQLKAAMPRVPLAFTAPGLRRLPVKPTTDCAFGPAVNPKGKEASKCWNGKTQYLQYDVASDDKIIKQLGVNLATLKSYANQGVMETTIVVLDATAPVDGLHKRQEFLEEKVMADSSAAEKEDNSPFVASTHGSSGDKVFQDDPPTGGRPGGGPIPACFSTQSACEAATDSCSGHGLCVDRWGPENTEKSCFYCQCKKARAHANSTLSNWGGAMCQKRDVSTPFWLFASVGLTLLFTTIFAIGLLYDVGDQKLPGVIGAGVSRSK